MGFCEEQSRGQGVEESSRDKIAVRAPQLAVSAQVVGLCVALIPTGSSGLRPGAPAPGLEGDVPLAPRPTDIDPAGSGPAMGRWTLTSFEGDLTVTVTPVVPLCTASVAAHTPMLDGSYLQLDPDGVLRFALKWESSTDPGFTYDYTDRAGAQSSWSWPEASKAAPRSARCSCTASS